MQRARADETAQPAQDRPRQREAAWLSECAALPVAFAQVREDALVDAWIVERLRDARVTMVASGGCTAALLAVSPRVRHLLVVDPNPAQIALTRLKLALLPCSVRQRLSLLGHRAMGAQARLKGIEKVLAPSGVAPVELGPLQLVARQGPDHAGRYEQLFVTLRSELAGVRVKLRQLLGMEDPGAQAVHAARETTLGRALDKAFDTVLALPILVRLFGPDAVQNPVEPFSRHFAGRTRAVLAAMPARNNPYLWQMLAGRYPPNCLNPWLALSPQLPHARVELVNAKMNEALSGVVAANDLVHLSNILDWLTPQSARKTLDLARRSLRPGGYVVIRQLNSSLDVPALGAGFRWLENDAKRLHHCDSSFFYRQLHIGRRA
jgi:S-adenosylmethionine-diacylglycerol 3-amino-3-carboxypropyl transferase